MWFIFLQLEGIDETGSKKKSKNPATSAASRPKKRKPRKIDDDFWGVNLVPIKKIWSAFEIRVGKECTKCISLSRKADFWYPGEQATG